MPHRSPARYLAPLALVGFAVALLLVIGGSTGNGDEEPATPTATVQRTTEQRQRDREGAEDDGTRRRRRPQTYTVVAGDTPSGIAEKTGVPLETIEELNPDLNPQALSVGDEIRIR
jgi:hypothetical protein